MKKFGSFVDMTRLRRAAVTTALCALSLITLAAPGQTRAAPAPWLTFMGGSSDDGIEAIVRGRSGNLYVSGSSSASWGTPIRAYQKKGDAFVAKISADGELIWNTFLGGSGDDGGHSIAVDANENVYVTGSSSNGWGSPLHPINPGWSDAFLAKLNSNGNLQWNTFFGASGEGEALGDWGSGITIDSGGKILVAGTSTESWGSPKRPFPAVPPAYIAFVAKFNANGAIQWNTFLGDSVYTAIKLDPAGNIYLSGTGSVTWGTPIDPYYGDMDNFVAKLNSAGDLQWNTFMGGGSGDYAGNFAVDAAGNVYITGMSGFPWGTPKLPFKGIYDAYVIKLSTDGNLMWHTFLGGPAWDSGSDVILDGDYVFLLGWTRSSWGNPLQPFSGKQNAFIASLNIYGDLIKNTFMNGDGAIDAIGFVKDPYGNLFVAGNSGGTWGTPKRPYTSGKDGYILTALSQPLMDTALPTVNLTKTGTDGSGRKFIQMTARDKGSGIARIEVLVSKNATTVIPPFAQGTTLPLQITSTKIDQSKASVVSLRVTDAAGNVVVGDPVLELFTIAHGKKVKQTFNKIPAAEHYVSILNGSPGLKRVQIFVNGTMFKAVALTDNGQSTVDVGPAMNDGWNKITFVGKGKIGDSAFLIIGDRLLKPAQMLKVLQDGQAQKSPGNFSWGEMEADQ